MRSAIAVACVLASMCCGGGARAQALAMQSADSAEHSPFAIGIDALDWQLKDSPLPVPVVTDGVLGQPGTHVLLGDQDLSSGFRRGARISAAYAFSKRLGIEGNFFRLQSRTASAGIESSGEYGSTDIFLPYIDASTGQESASELSYATIYRGGAREELSNRLQGAELNTVWAFSPGASWRVGLLGGLRYLRLSESYTLTTHSPYLDAFGPDVWETTDKFSTRNSFYGIQAGARAHFEQGRFFAAGSLKVAVGGMRQSVGITGELVTNDFTSYGPLQTFPGGYFALPSNIGEYSRTRFAVVPEAALHLGFRITSAVSINLGYSLLYANNVARPGNQMSRTINTTQSVSYTESLLVGLDGPRSPKFAFKDSSFWAQGINVGLTVRF